MQESTNSPRYHHLTHSSNAAMQHYHPARGIHVCVYRSRTSRPANRWRIPMKTMILAAVAALSLGVGAAYAQGVPAGYQEPHYGGGSVLRSSE
jgi:hypothetical protein